MIERERESSFFRSLCAYTVTKRHSFVFGRNIQMKVRRIDEFCTLSSGLSPQICKDKYYVFCNEFMNVYILTNESRDS